MIRDISLAADGRIILDVGWTKTILQDGGLVKALSARSSHRHSEWITAEDPGGKPDAMIFCPVHRSNQITGMSEMPMSAPCLEDIYRRARHAAGENKSLKTNKGRYIGILPSPAAFAKFKTLQPTGFPPRNYHCYNKYQCKQYDDGRRRRAVDKER